MALLQSTACNICGKEKPGFAAFGMAVPNGKAAIIPKENLLSKNLAEGIQTLGSLKDQGVGLNGLNDII